MTKRKKKLIDFKKMNDGKEDEKNREALRMKLKTGTAQTRTAIRTPTSPIMTDTDEEMDTAVIEEEDWIEYKKRSTEEAMEQMKNTKNPTLDQNS